MSNNELLNKLLGTAKLLVMMSDFVSEEKLHLEVASMLAVASYPQCGLVSNQVYDESEAQRVRDLFIAERQCFLVYRARRFKCKHCKKTFVERVEWKRPNVSYTQRYERYIYQRVRRESVGQVAQDEDLSEEAVQGLFEIQGKKTTEARGCPQVRAIRFDEISLHRDTASLCWSSRRPNWGLAGCFARSQQGNPAEIAGRTRI